MSRDMSCWDYGQAKIKAERLSDLIHGVINQNFYDGNDLNDGEGVLIRQIGNTFSIAFTEEHGGCYIYSIEATPEAVNDFIEELVELKERIEKELEDKYDQWGILRKEYYED